MLMDIRKRQCICVIRRERARKIETGNEKRKRKEGREGRRKKGFTHQYREINVSVGLKSNHHKVKLRSRSTYLVKSRNEGKENKSTVNGKIN